MVLFGCGCLVFNWSAVYVELQKIYSIVTHNSEQCILQ